MTFLEQNREIESSIKSQGMLIILENNNNLLICCEQISIRPISANDYLKKIKNKSFQKTDKKESFVIQSNNVQLI